MKEEHLLVSFDLIILNSLNEDSFNLCSESVMSYSFPPPLSLVLSELFVEFAQFIPEEQRQNDVWT